MEKSNNSTFVIFIFLIFKFWNIGRSTRNYCHTQYVVYYHTHSKNIDKCGKNPQSSVENQITTLSVVKIAIKFSPCIVQRAQW